MNAPAGYTAVHCTVHGRVQGVGFRYSAREAAVRLGMHGWVRNKWDGSVEVYAEGPADRVQQYTEWLRRGPPGARVEKLECTEQPYEDRYPRFTVEY